MRNFLNLKKTAQSFIAGFTGREGQMTVEFVVAFPVLLVIALISTNAILFFSECSGFDREFRQEVSRLASSPAYEQSSGDIAGQIQTDLIQSFNRDYLEVSVSTRQSSAGLVTYEGVISFSPTLFGAGNLKGIFGVSFPKLQHHQKIAIDEYKPGVLL